MENRRDKICNELLVIKCQQGDRAAFNELVDRWQKRLWGYAFKVTGSEAAAWDIVQETWYGVIKGLRKLDDATVFPCWIFRILNNKYTDWLRKEQLQRRLNENLEESILNKSNQKVNEKSQILQTAIEKLTTERRALITLRYREDFDIGQIAEILNIPQGTVKSRLHRTLNRLRELMEHSENG